MESILIVEDDPQLGRSLKQGLQENGYAAGLVSSGAAARKALGEEPPDLVILDLGLPDCDGLELLATIRANAGGLMVLILTARDTLTDKVHGLDSGADDYLTKPFAFAELLARVRALARRSQSVDTTITAWDIQVDLIARRVLKNDCSIDLTPREFDLLAYLASHAGEVVSRDMLARDVWHETSRFTPLDNVIDVHVSRLRRKLADSPGGCAVRVVRGVGIMLVGD